MKSFEAVGDENNSVKEKKARTSNRRGYNRYGSRGKTSRSSEKVRERNVGEEVFGMSS